MIDGSPCMIAFASARNVLWRSPIAPSPAQSGCSSACSVTVSKSNHKELVHSCRTVPGSAYEAHNLTNNQMCVWFMLRAAVVQWQEYEWVKVQLTSKCGRLRRSDGLCSECGCWLRVSHAHAHAYAHALAHAHAYVAQCLLLDYDGHVMVT